jgi:hypothetical protein
MERKIEQCSLALIGRLPQICKPNEFMVAYFIINTMSIEKKDRIKIYRGKLADLCNMTERNISRITERLNQIGIIQKELIGDAEKKKTFNYYRLNWQFIEDFLAKFDNEESTFLPKLSGLKNERIEEDKNKNEIKEKKVEVKKTFSVECGEKQSESSTVEDEDCDWKTELIRLESRIKRASSIDELKTLSLQFNIMQNKSGIPTELEELLERVQNTAKAKVWSIKAKKCYT